MGNEYNRSVATRQCFFSVHFADILIMIFLRKRGISPVSFLHDMQFQETWQVILFGDGHLRTM